MKRKGWIYCSRMISDCPPGVPIQGAEYYSCRRRLANPHWHRVFEEENRHSFINWEITFTTPDQETWNSP
jgi:hypothetical protein